MNNIAKKSGRIELEDGKYINWADNLEKNTDAFGTRLAQNTRNVADLAAHYPYNPERWRIDVDGVRQNIQYGSIPQYNKQPDYHELIPGQGETVRLKTAERFRYVVGFVIEPSYAYALSRTLETGDKLVFGYGEDDLHNDMASADGWFWEYTPDLDDNQVDLTEYRNGTEVDRNTVPIEKAVNIWTRRADRINWYNVGNRQAIETYTEDGEQLNPFIGNTSVDNGRGPESGNHRIVIAIQRGASSSAITLEAGSVGVKVLGDTDAIKRSKIGESSYTFSTTGEWVPIFAVRVKDSYKLVNTSLVDLNIVEWGGSGDVEILVKNCDPSLVLDSGGNALEDSDYSTDELMTEVNTAVEVTTNVDQAPDSSGTSQASIATGPLGGYTVGYASFNQQGGGQNTVRTQNALQVKRIIPDGDVAVFWGRAENSSEVKFQYVTEQDW